jgi:uncharacterized membrane protein YeaQ/YmgE (transglycosylase-associated protein family)
MIRSGRADRSADRSNEVGMDLVAARARPHAARRTPEGAMPTVSQFIVWIVVGLLGGSVAGTLITWQRRGYGLLRNLVLGLVGALIGGLLFRLFGLFPELDRIAISLRDVVAAFVGSLIVLLGLWLWQRSKGEQ